MKNFRYIVLALTFIMAGLSAMMFWGQGVSYWLWQVVVMLLVIGNVEKQLTIEDMKRKISELIKKIEEWPKQ